MDINTSGAGAVAALLYCSVAVLQFVSLRQKKTYHRYVLLFGFFAVLLHFLDIILSILERNGPLFTVTEISTIIAVTISSIILISSLKKPLLNLLIIVFPLAALSILASLFSAGKDQVSIIHPSTASHILLSILAYSIFSIAAIQAIIIAYQNFQLKNHRTEGILQAFPSLQDMESLLFEILWVGQILLSLGIFAGLSFSENIWTLTGMIHKTFFSIVAWTVFTILLWGRSKLGWRGYTAIKFTLAGFILLFLGFYGSKIVIEYFIS